MDFLLGEGVFDGVVGTITVRVEIGGEFCYCAEDDNIVEV
jgi:hypothetical protein